MECWFDSSFDPMGPVGNKGDSSKVAMMIDGDGSIHYYTTGTKPKSKSEEVMNVDYSTNADQEYLDRHNLTKRRFEDCGIPKEIAEIFTNADYRCNKNLSFEDKHYRYSVYARDRIPHIMIATTKDAFAIIRELYNFEGVKDLRGESVFGFRYTNVAINDCRSEVFIERNHTKDGGKAKGLQSYAKDSSVAIGYVQFSYKGKTHIIGIGSAKVHEIGNRDNETTMPAARAIALKVYDMPSQVEEYEINDIEAYITRCRSVAHKLKGKN